MGGGNIDSEMGAILIAHGAGMQMVGVQYPTSHSPPSNFQELSHV